MKSIKLLAIIFIIAIFTECSKKDHTPADVIVGEWIFTTQFSQSFAYPSILSNPTPFTVSSWSNSSDSIKLTFDNNGNYSFANFRLPLETGKYLIALDSILVINPDTSGFLKFCYSTPNFYATSVILPVTSPYSNYRFKSDTIYFKRSGDKNIIFSTFWLNFASAPIQPNLDTLVLTQAHSTFKKS